MPYVDPVVYPPLFADEPVDSYVLFSTATRASAAQHGLRLGVCVCVYVCVQTHKDTRANVSSHVSSEITSSHIHKE